MTDQDDMARALRGERKVCRTCVYYNKGDSSVYSLGMCTLNIKTVNMFEDENLVPIFSDREACRSYRYNLNFGKYDPGKSK